MPLEWISRAEAARRLGVSPMAITKFCHRGMPHRVSDGKVCWPDAIYWSDFYRRPQASGNWRARHREYDEAEEAGECAAREARWPQVQAWYRLYEMGMDTAAAANRAIARHGAGRGIGG